MNNARFALTKLLWFAGCISIAAAAGGQLVASVPKLAALLVSARANARASRGPIDVLLILDGGGMDREQKGLQIGIADYLASLESAGFDPQVGLLLFSGSSKDSVRLLSFHDQPFSADLAELGEELEKLPVQTGARPTVNNSLGALLLAADQPFRPAARKVLVLITASGPRISVPGGPSLPAVRDKLQQREIDQFYLIAPEDVLPAYADLQGRFARGNLKLGATDVARRHFELLLPQLTAQMVAATDSSRSFAGAMAWLNESFTIAVALAIVSLCGLAGLVMGQNFYMGRRPTWTQLTIGGGWGASAGFAGAITAFGVASVLGLLGLGASVQGFRQVTTALLIGALIGWLGRRIVPNLSWFAAPAGAVAAGLASGFTLGYPERGPGSAGVAFQAGLLGLAIGAAIALVEGLGRKEWLEVRFANRRPRSVNLGSRPVLVGGDPNQVDVLVPHASAVTLRYSCQRGEVLCQDERNSQTSVCPPGALRQVGPATLLVGPPRDVECAFTLRLSNGRTVSLSLGTILTAADLPGVQSNPPGNRLAEVCENPKNVAIWGLKNLTARSWSAVNPRGELKQIDTSRSMPLAVGVRIDFGPIQGEII